jgi:Selenocysteine lyase
MMEFEEYRSQFPVAGKFAYLNHAAISAPSLKVVRALDFINNDLVYNGITSYPDWMRRIEEVRKLFAGLINARSDEIAFVGNTSEGLSHVAQSLLWKEGDVVLLPVPEFPANVYPWLNLKRKGVKVSYIRRREGRFTVKDVEKALSSRVRLISASYVDFIGGFRCDLEAIGDLCRRKGILFCVDAIQGLGAIPLDVKRCGIHFLAAGGHKWLLSVMGIGGLFVSREIMDIVRPACVGWKSVVEDDNFFDIRFDLKPNATGFESGAMNVAGIYALGAAIELLNKVEIKRINERIFALNDLFFGGLKKRGFKVVTSMEREERSGILSFVPPSDPGAIYRFLTGRDIMVSLRGNLIRISPHFYNNRTDVGAFFDALDDFSR